MMEGVAWFSHKYIMHGIGWVFHKDHHQHKPSFFERNDVFFLLFATPSAILIYNGVVSDSSWMAAAGAGIAIYGAAYFLVHDVFIHQRVSWLRNTNNTYLRAIRKAHKIHHKNLNKDGGECFGMLWVPLKFYREAANSWN